MGIEIFELGHDVTFAKQECIKKGHERVLHVCATAVHAAKPVSQEL